MNAAVTQRRKVGATPLSLPVMGFGAAHLGELYEVVTEVDAQTTLAAAWDAGLRYYDTAPWYGRGLAEHRLGGMLRTRRRDEFQITTKVGRTLHRPADPRAFDRSPWVGGLNFDVHFDYSYDGVLRSYEQALQRLSLDTVDALLIHDLDTLTHGDQKNGHERALADSGMRALQELKSGGQIAAIGRGFNTAESFNDVAGWAELDFALVAMPYTLLDQSTLHKGMADCVRRGISVVIGAPFASGILVTGSRAGAMYAYGKASAAMQEKVRGIEAICAIHQVSMAAAALQFVLAHPAVVSVIPGAKRASEVMANIAALDAVIPAAFWADLKTAGLIVADAPVPE